MTVSLNEDIDFGLDRKTYTDSLDCGSITDSTISETYDLGSAIVDRVYTQTGTPYVGDPTAHPLGSIFTNVASVNAGNTKITTDAFPGEEFTKSSELHTYYDQTVGKYMPVE